MSTDGRRKRVTLKDVAALASVDASVVSRLLNGDATLSVRDATRKRVFDAVRQLDYQPNLAARALRTSRGTMIALLVPELTNPLYAELVAGASKKAAELGYSIVLVEHEDHHVDPGAMRSFPQRGIDGLIVAGGTLQAERLHEFHDYDFPVVVVNRKIEGLPWALVDDVAGTALAAEHLLELGHRDIGIVGGPEGLDTTTRRCEELERVISAGGGRVTRRISVSDRSAVVGQTAARELTDGALPTAVFVDNAMLAVGVVKGLAAAGVCIPEQLSVIALHDLELADFTWPPLTTVALAMGELGGAAVQQLVDAREGRPPESVVLSSPPVLRDRGSTGRVHDPS